MFQSRAYRFSWLSAGRGRGRASVYGVDKRVLEAHAKRPSAERPSGADGRETQGSRLQTIEEPMPFSGASYDPETLDLMTGVFDAAYEELRATGVAEATSEAVRTMMAIRIMAAVASGECDPRRLKLLALHAVDGRPID
jgi:hypothetical protein